VPLTHLTSHQRNKLLYTWLSIEQRVIDASIDKWRAQLKACLRANGGYFEHML